MTVFSAYTEKKDCFTGSKYNGWFGGNGKLKLCIY